MILFPQRMQRLSAVVLHADADVLTRKLLDAGIMDFIDVLENEENLGLKSGSLRSAGTAENGQQSGEHESQLSDLRRRIEMFLQDAGLPLPRESSIRTDSRSTPDLERIGRRLDQLAADIQQVRDSQQAVQQEIHRLTELQNQLALFGDITEIVPAGSYVDVQAGLIGKSRYSSLQSGLKPYPAYLHRSPELSDDQYEYPVLLISMSRDRQRIDELLDRVQWKSITVPPEFRGLKGEAVGEISGRIAAAKKRQKELADSARNLTVKLQPELEEAWREIRLGQLLRSMELHYGTTRETVLFSGWIPARLRGQTERIIRETVGDRCALEWTEPEKNRSIDSSQVPVLMEHKRILLPFQWLVQNYSIPRYGSIDPTVLVTVTYLLMFGLMFGDAGHGAVLLLVGLLLSRRRRSAGENDTALKLGKLIAWCGAAAVVTGALFGSYFGYSWLPPLWFDYHGIVSGHGGGSSPALVSSIYDILGITIRFGVAVIVFGIALNCVNRFRRRDWLGLVFDHGGLLGLWFYLGGTAAAFQFVASGYSSLPSGPQLVLTVGLPALLFLLKAPLEQLRHGEGSRSIRLKHIPSFIMEWVVELLELFTSYLSNTLSFMRIAGLGIAHVSLMTAFFQIAGSIASPAASVAVLIAGNAVVIVLEGLSAGIQALRLHYYEFFSRYFSGSGRIYRPVSLRRAG